ncbi:MAG: histidine kinase [Thermoleophilia bacterium]
MLRAPARAIRSAASRYGDAALGTAVGAMLLLELVGADGLSGSERLVGGALSVLVGGAVAFRRRAPLAFLAGVVALSLAAVVDLVPHSESGLAWALVGLIAVYTVASSPRPGTRRAGMVLAVALVAAWILDDLDHVDFDAGVIVGYVVFAAVPWVFGRAIGRRRERERGLEQRALILERGAQHLARRAVEDERVRIAREIHDVVGHALGVIVVQADGAARLLPTDPDESGRALATIGRTGREALEEMRRLVGLLRTSEDDPALDPAPGVAQLDALADQMRVAGLPVEVVVEGVAERLPPSIDVSAFRIAQEALTNVLRHAGPASARVLVRYRDDAVEVSVEDDGRGPAGGPGADGSGHGLVGIRERVAAFGGEMEAGARPAGGFAVRALLPYGSRA